MQRAYCITSDQSVSSGMASIQVSYILWMQYRKHCMHIGMCMCVSMYSCSDAASNAFLSIGYESGHIGVFDTRAAKFCLHTQVFSDPGMRNG